MTVIEALFLGLIQGITEFLPISSSAHLIIFRHFMKIEDTQTVFFNVLLHFGSMIAIAHIFEGMETSLPRAVRNHNRSVS